MAYTPKTPSKRKRPWPQKRRDAASKRAKANKPWKRSTGPRTNHGKAVSAQNAFIHGKCSLAYRLELMRLHDLLNTLRVNTHILDISTEKCINSDRSPNKDFGEITTKK